MAADCCTRRRHLAWTVFTCATAGMTSTSSSATPAMQTPAARSSRHRGAGTQFAHLPRGRATGQATRAGDFVALGSTAPARCTRSPSRLSQHLATLVLPRGYGMPRFARSSRSRTPGDFRDVARAEDDAPLAAARRPGGETAARACCRGQQPSVAPTAPRRSAKCNGRFHAHRRGLAPRPGRLVISRLIVRSSMRLPSMDRHSGTCRRSCARIDLERTGAGADQRGAADSLMALRQADLAPQRMPGQDANSAAASERCGRNRVVGQRAAFARSAARRRPASGPGHGSASSSPTAVLDA